MKYIIVLLIIFLSGQIFAKDSKNLSIGQNVWKTEYSIDSGSILIISVTLKSKDSPDSFISVWAKAIKTWGEEHPHRAVMLLVIIDESMNHEEIREMVIFKILEDQVLNQILLTTGKSTMLFGTHSGEIISEYEIGKP